MQLDAEALERRLHKYRTEIVALRDRYGREYFETQNREAFAKAQVLQDVLNVLRDTLAAPSEP